jgi:hypothetical protein
MPAVPPFPDTTYFCRDIIRDSDPTAFVNNLTDAGQGQREVYDRRRGGVTANAYLFNATYYDGLTVEIQVLTEFDNENADIRELAETYGRALGQLPTGVRTSVKSMPIIPGNMPWGGGNNAVTIHAGRPYGDMRGVTLMHEAAHASLELYAFLPAPAPVYFTPNLLWKAAQQADDAFISNYARDNPEREDVAESYVAYVAVRYRSARISPADADKIVRTIPNRIAFFDARPLPMDPIIQLPPPLKLVRAKASSERASFTTASRRRPIVSSKGRITEHGSGTATTRAAIPSRGSRLSSSTSALSTDSTFAGR